MVLTITFKELKIMKTNTTFKILNANTNKRFTTIEDLESYIDNKKIIPNDLTNSLIIEKNTIETFEIDNKFGQEEITINGAVKFLQLFKNLSKIIKIEVDTNIKWIIHYINSRDFYESYELTKYLTSVIRSKNYTEKYLISVNSFYGVDKSGEFTKIFLEFIDHMIDNVDFYHSNENLKWIKINTNYKPCNFMGMMFKLDKMSKLYIGIRDGDLLISTIAVYGRNVRFNSIHNLNDNDIVELYNNIEFKHKT